MPREPAVLRALRYVGIAVTLYRLIKYLRSVSNSHSISAYQRKLVAERSDLATPLSAKPTDLFSRFFANRARLWLFHRHWLPEGGAAAARGTVFLVHGYGEHSGRYGHVAAHLTQIGMAVFALDHQGHGQSEGERAYVEKFEHYVEDVVQYVQYITSAEPFASRPRVLLGHSMGGLIAAHTVKAAPDLFSALALSGPALAADPKVASPVMRFLSSVLSNVFPKLSLESLPPDLVSRNKDVVRAYELDPLGYHGGMQARWGNEMLKAMDSIQASAADISLPVLIMHGGADGLCSIEGSRTFFDGVSSSDKTMKEYPGLYHEVFNEPEREEVLGDLCEWIDARIA